MPVPKRKRSRQRRDKRFANKGLSIGQVGLCTNCDFPLLSHQVCRECGFYKGRKVLTTKLERGLKRTEVSTAIQEKQAARQAKTEQAETTSQKS